MSHVLEDSYGWPRHSILLEWIGAVFFMLLITWVFTGEPKIIVLFDEDDFLIERLRTKPIKDSHADDNIKPIDRPSPRVVEHGTAKERTT